MARKLAGGDPAIARLVERQLRNWELARAQRLEIGPPERSVVEDFICVSRQVGADGGEVARRLGRRLGWPVFDRELLEAMAGDDATRRQVYESMDERDLNWWEETLRSVMQSEFIRNDYFRRLSETLLSLARQGNCVFLGRGADLILPRSRGFRVRLVAPSARRLERFSRNRGLSREDSEQDMKKIEAERARFFRRHFGVDIEDPVRYDMTVNTDRFTAEQLVEMILQGRAIRCRTE